MYGFARTFSWLARAFRLHSADSPQYLGGMVMPVIDISQMGHGFNPVASLQMAQIIGSGAGAQDHIVDDGATGMTDPETQTVVTELALQLLGGGAARAVEVLLYHFNTGLNVVLASAALDPAAGNLGRVGSRQLLLGKGIAVPPGHYLVLRVYTLAVGQTLNVQYRKKVIPVGIAAEW